MPKNGEDKGSRGCFSWPKPLPGHPAVHFSCHFLLYKGSGGDPTEMQMAEFLAEVLDKAIRGCCIHLSQRKLTAECGKHDHYTVGALPALIGLNGLILILLAPTSVCENERSSL